MKTGSTSDWFSSWRNSVKNQRGPEPGCWFSALHLEPPQGQKRVSNGKFIILQTKAHTSLLVLVFGYLLYKFLSGCCNAVWAPPSPAPTPTSPAWVTRADIPQWRRQSSGPVPYLRTQTAGHRKHWSLSTILRAKHSKFPNLLIQKQYAKLYPPSLSSSCPAPEATAGNRVASGDREALPQRQGAGLGPGGFHLTTQHRISHSERRGPRQAMCAGGHRPLPFLPVQALDSVLLQGTGWGTGVRLDVRPGIPPASACPHSVTVGRFRNVSTLSGLICKRATIVEPFPWDCCED